MVGGDVTTNVIASVMRRAFCSGSGFSGAARQLIFIGEQNNVRTQLEPGEQTITSNARGRG